MWRLNKEQNIKRQDWPMCEPFICFRVERVDIEAFPLQHSRNLSNFAALGTPCKV
jgi:hypothetical protein